MQKDKPLPEPWDLGVISLLFFSPKPLSSVVPAYPPTMGPRLRARVEILLTPPAARGP